MHLLSCRLRLSGLLVLFFLTPCVHADTVWMKNGDRLSGTVRSLSGGKLVMDTSYGGTLSLNWSSVSTLSSEKAIDVRNGQQVFKAQLEAADPGYIVVRRGADEQRVQITRFEEFMKPKPKTDALTWTGNIDMGISLKKASTRTQDSHFAYNNKVNIGKWRNDFGGTYRREKEDDTMNTENYSLRYALDYQFRDRLFWQGRASYKRDWVEDLSQQALLGTGPGYQFWDDELGSFSLALLGGAFTYGYSDGSSDSHLGASLRWDYQRFLQGRKIALFSHGDVGHSLDDNIFTMDAEVGLRYQLTSWSSLNITYGHNLVSGTRDTLNERDFTTGLGLKW
ncbi:DUF481 domain-containing protein [Erwinia sp. BNK-24-b]|uniref:DUF481 domain-containing protein n=1 Tax=unclassified Erwinia TaxID=2622719 RepID=UPI0039BF0611